MRFNVMKEKILVLAITIISVLSALVSCSQVPNEELPIETTVTPETTEAIPDDPVINSFYEDYVNFSFHPEDDYAYLIALSESTTWEKPAMPVANVLLTSVSISAISAAS